ARAGVDAKELDFVLVSSMCPDYLVTNNAPAVQSALGMREDVFALETQGVCNSFLLQLTLAEAMVRSGQARRGVIIQSAPLTKLMDVKEPFSVWFGDGATAVVVGEVGEGEGLLATTHRGNGAPRVALVAAAGERSAWHDGQ